MNINEIVLTTCLIQVAPLFPLMSLFLFQDPILHSVVISFHAIILLSSFVFHDLDTLKDKWAIILQNMPPFGFVWLSSRPGWGCVVLAWMPQKSCCVFLSAHIMYVLPMCLLSWRSSWLLGVGGFWLVSPLSRYISLCNWQTSLGYFETLPISCLSSNFDLLIYLNPSVDLIINNYHYNVYLMVILYFAHSLYMN